MNGNWRYHQLLSAGLGPAAAETAALVLNLGLLLIIVIIAHLKNNPNIRQDMTFLVRQLPPTEHGLPLEIYVFSRDQRWAFYEAFQNPSGHDLSQLGAPIAGSAAS